MRYLTLVATLYFSFTSNAVANNSAINDIFVKCAENIKRHNQKVLMMHAGAWPESLSFFSDIASQDAAELHKSSNQLEQELEHFPAIYKASSALAAQHCPHLKANLSKALRKKFILTHELKNGFDVLAPVLKAQEKASGSFSNLRLAIESYERIVSSIKGGG